MSDDNQNTIVVTIPDGRLGVLCSCGAEMYVENLTTQVRIQHGENPECSCFFTWQQVARAFETEIDPLADWLNDVHAYRGLPPFELAGMRERRRQ